MYAAREGKSTLGIPKKVGAEYIAADKAAGNPKLPAKAGKKKPGPEHAKKLASALSSGGGGYHR